MPTAVRIATYNIHRCVGGDGRHDPRRIAAVLKSLDADILALQEVAYAPDTRYDVLRYLAGVLGARVIAGPTLWEKEGRYGNALLTRLDVRRAERIDISVAGREPRGILQLQPDPGIGSVVVLATHLGLSLRERRYQIGRIAELLETITAETVILMGDFNEWRPSGAALNRFNTYFGTRSSPRTFPSRRPLLPLDRIWVRPAAALKRMQVLRDHRTRWASDHLPLIADIIL
jgi:endonuclease/exonuclease/phosphatase family metal-dependent hydrolase